MWACRWRELRPISFGGVEAADRGAGGEYELVGPGEREAEAGASG